MCPHSPDVPAWVDNPFDPENVAFYGEQVHGSEALRAYHALVDAGVDPVKAMLFADEPRRYATRGGFEACVPVMEANPVIFAPLME